MDEFTKELIYLLIGATIGGIITWKIALLRISGSKKQESSKGI